MKSLTFTRHFSSSIQKWKPNQNPNFTITHPTLLLVESCTCMHHLKQLHAHMTRTGLIFHLFPISRLIAFCALNENGSVSYANSLFSLIPNPNTYIWNTMIRGCVKDNDFGMGLSYFRKMVEENVEMDRRSFVFVLKGCGVWAGKAVHGRIWKVGFVKDLIVRNGLVHFYGERGLVPDALKVFDESCVKDVVSWTSMIDGYVKAGLVEEALGLFDLMGKFGVEPNEVTMIMVFSACGKKGDLSSGRRFHELLVNKGVRCGVNLMNAMLDMFAKCGRLGEAKHIFDKMEKKDVFSWTSMINGYAKNGEVELARKTFDEMPERNLVSWNAMIAGYSQNNRPAEALELFDEMERKELVPMESTLVCVLSACGQLSCLDMGRWVHDYYVKQKRIELSAILGNALIDMYAKCGSIDAAGELFNDMPQKDLVTWNSMIAGYASHGHAKEALNLFEQMKNMGFEPDDITFVGVLSACAHGGLVNQGWRYFRNMELFGLVPTVEHYACMTDLLGRVGRLEEAYDLIMSMPIQSDAAVWGALLNGCRMHGNVELGKLAAEKLIVLDPQDSGIYALLASLCAKKREWAGVSTIRSIMRANGIKKNPGCSLIEVEGQVHEFLVADESHPHSEAIYKVLDRFLLLSKPEDDASDSILIDAFS